ncbi:MAG: phosphoglycolate phosphatase [Gammaproteobacteria bacterium]|nr:phosphoglycolate phosphatase [Gammaproteobacteria bacterium]
MNSTEMILIDLDGTLVDSVPDLAFCIDGMMTELERPTHGESRVRDWVGNGVERLVKRALVGQLEGEPDPLDFKRAYPVFMDLYDKHNGARSKLYPGVLEGLKKLAADNYHLGCVTNKAAQFSVPLLKALDIHRYFSLVISGDTLPEKKPHPMPLLHGASHFNTDPAHALMLGDSVSDVKAARAAGFPIICVNYGYNHGADIRDANPDAVIASFTELETLLTPGRQSWLQHA